ncbi:hypothetical protein KUTeg_005541 [Tegillarca granosa]|uniref:Uncharacterized protein n=1 Tax=Tegillarca granosa TaxID=220873 RepID=A0ABQ9FNW9_TEGGR|nr:hypothetical protein KUTeg_005541 [Tegillarca granosa]
MAAPIKLEALFDKRRLQDRLTVILSVIYFPLGLALVIVRLFMSVHVVLISCLLPRSQFTSFVLKTIYSVIGISVIVEDNEHQNMKAKVLVSNHISTLDHMAIDLIHSNIVVSVQSHLYIGSHGYRFDSQ